MCIDRVFFSNGRRHTICALVTGVQTCAPPISEGFVAMMSEPNATSGGRYSKMQTWLAGRDGLPADTFFMQGHDGQAIAIVPSLDLRSVERRVGKRCVHNCRYWWSQEPSKNKY